ncbi:unnamed protein product [Lactuca saligna]|uniref:Uncharacterized protein n=1 Tax=Lactuca saligna TaxID=75948 RepID=A0AA35URL0_LACSI|nr:unnamed protein product [Lactuca saligna]
MLHLLLHQREESNLIKGKNLPLLHNRVKANVLNPNPIPPPTHEVTPPLNDYVPSPPSSLKKTTFTPITIKSCPPPVSSQPPTSIPVSILIFTECTIPPQASSAPISSVNVSDMGANASGFSSHFTQPISSIRIDDPDIIFGDDEDDMGEFTYIPFQIRIYSEDEASARGNSNLFMRRSTS